MIRWGSWIVLVALCGVWVTVDFFRHLPQEPWDFADLARLPVVCQGRLQPLDSVARNSLLLLRHRQTLRLPSSSAVPSEEKSPSDRELPSRPRYSGTSIPAIVWLAEVLFRPQVADQLPTFRIDYPELRDFLGIPKTHGKYFSFTELKPLLNRLETQARQAMEAEHRDPFQKNILQLYTAISVYQRLKNTIAPETTTNFFEEVQGYLDFLPAGLKAFQDQQGGKKFDSQELQRLRVSLDRYHQLAEAAFFFPVPPKTDVPGQDKDQWISVGEALLQTVHHPELHPTIRAFAMMREAYQQGDPQRFRQDLEEYLYWLEREHPRALAQVNREGRYYLWAPFYHAMVLYLFAFLCACFSWLGGFGFWRRVGIGIALVAFATHTGGILLRMWIEHRPPVTNLYSSAVFVGWGAVVFGLLLERRYPQSLGLAMASFVGFLSQAIAHQLSLRGDTFEVLQAVLDTNFWLVTHVVTITLGYSAVFLAGFLGILYILRDVFPRRFPEESQTALASMIYGTICFATAFSFLGTVFGGIWADQAWGRFWGWDPKENGALLIVLWNAMILHARAAGWARGRGLANLAIGGNIVTAFCWFGVNMLGVGLHSYGFMERAFVALIGFVISQLVFIGLGLFTPMLRKRAR